MLHKSMEIKGMMMIQDVDSFQNRWRGNVPPGDPMLDLGLCSTISVKCDQDGLKRDWEYTRGENL